MAKYKLRCYDCRYEMQEDRYYVTCPECNGGLEVVLSATNIAGVDNSLPSIFKYHRYLPIDEKDITVLISKEDIEDTPIIFTENISKLLGIKLYMKDELQLPTGTWKDKEGFISIYRLWKTGVSDLVLFSSGNTGMSLARSATLFQGPKLHLIVPESSRQRIEHLKHLRHPKYVSVYYAQGSNDECMLAAKTFAKEKKNLTKAVLKIMRGEKGSNCLA